MSLILYTIFIALTGVERLVELVVSKRNAAWSMAQGGFERGQEHYPFMVILHTSFLVGCVIEVWVMDRPLILWLAIAMLILALLSQALRWWCITTLGRYWNTRVIVVPGAERVTGGPYQWMTHPNYVAVVIEGVALPMMHTAYITAIVFTLLNAVMLWVRISVENKALTAMHSK